MDFPVLERDPDFRLEARPKSYFEGRDIRRHVPSRVRGQFRRFVANEAIENGVADDLPPALLSEGIEKRLRDALGKTHPSLMGGEYLPGLGNGEVEIARVVLRSVTGDVISVRARPVGGRIAYRVVDEYSDGGSGESYRERTSKRPLSLRELLNYLEECCEGGILESYADFNFENGSGLDDLEGFVRAESAFYPQLAPCVDALMDAWMGARRNELGGAAGEEGDDEKRAA